MITATTERQARSRLVEPAIAQREAAYRTLLPAILLFYALVVPMEVRFNIADQTFYPPRIAAFLLLPWLIRRLAAGAMKFKAVDAIMISFIAWMIFSFVIYYDAVTGFLRSAPLAFDIIVPYLIARITIRNLTDLRRFLVLVAPAIFFAGATMAMESVTHTAFVKPFAANIFGRLSAYENGVAVGAASFFESTRLGLLRASGPFSHPILGGIFLASFIPLYLKLGLRGTPKWIALVGALCSFFSLSSGAFLVILLGLAIIALDKVQGAFQRIGWRSIVGVIIFAMAIIQIVSKNGLISILIRYTLDPATGRYRQLIWDYGAASVERHPWIGIGFTDFERPIFMGTSVDNQWLLIAMRHGLPAILALTLVVMIAVRGLSIAISSTKNLERNSYLGLMATLMSVVIAGFTVSYFGSALTLFYFVVGVAVSLGISARSSAL